MTKSVTDLLVGRLDEAAEHVDLAYARVDMVRDPALGWLLMELELIEPDFYLVHDPAAGAGFAKAVTERGGSCDVRQGPGPTERGPSVWM